MADGSLPTGIRMAVDARRRVRSGGAVAGSDRCAGPGARRVRRFSFRERDQGRRSSLTARGGRAACEQAQLSYKALWCVK